MIFQKMSFTEFCILNKVDVNLDRNYFPHQLNMEYY
jgi:hypothetical protein